MAVTTYKDAGLHITRRLDRALDVLAEAGPPETSQDVETLGVAGAIHKRKWEHTGRLEHLYRSLFFYRRGAAQGVAADSAYTAINAAFVLDLLADLEIGKDPDSSVPALQREQARVLREEAVAALRPPGGSGPSEWWPLLTLAEAYIGLGRTNDAAPWLERAKPLIRERPEWELEAFARQVAAIARLQGMAAGIEDLKTSPVGQRLADFLGERGGGAESAFLGKIGLALSGGGFRASLFHIGVLARLAELDALRRIEVLSCVSGGSILGAHYYLKARHLLGATPDAKLGREQFVSLVEELIEEFLAGVQQNIRVRLLHAPPRTLLMGVSPRYSRTLRAGELYESCLYNRVQDNEQDTPRRLPGLFITPEGWNEGEFKPVHDNWSRRAKVPILVLNATTLNTGHNWQYTASWMGEPPSAIDDDVDSADRLRRMYHSQAPEGRRETRLGHAVAASAGVPGLFPPVRITKLYEGLTVQLVDGGVHDNQGIASLLDQDCSVTLVSDASGQRELVERPAGDPLTVLPRMNSILMSRVRQAQHMDLAIRRATSVLRGMMFVHLRQGLDRHPRTWTGGDPATAADLPAAGVSPHTSYGVRKDVQRGLAELRTDLDAFSDLEAFALMNSGYRMTEESFRDCIEGLPPAVKHTWRFEDVDAAVTGGADHERLLRVLDAGKRRFFKLSRLSLPARVVGILVLLALVGGLLLGVWALGDHPVGVRPLAIAALIVAIVVVVSRFAPIVLQPLWAVLAVLAATIGWIGVRLHLSLVDRWYHRYGRVPPSG